MIEQRRELAGFRILARDIFEMHVQPAELAFDLDVVAISRPKSPGTAKTHVLIGADAGQTDRSRHVDVGRTAAAGFPREPENTSFSSRNPAKEIPCSIKYGAPSSPTGGLRACVSHE